MPTPKREMESPGPFRSDGSDDEAEDDGLYHDMGGFQVSRALPRYDEKRCTLRDLMILLNTPGGIDLDPPYQRGFVWNEERQIGVIDSLFQGYYVPGLIFNRRVETIFGNIRKETLVCIDGKQRLTSVKRFTEGLFPCHDRHGQKWWFQQAGENPTRGRKYLPQSAQAELWKKTFLCYEYVGMTDDQEHELFERVQRGNPLTHAEKSQAKKGEWQKLARSFQQDFLRVSNLSDNRRGAGHDKFISSFVQLVERQKSIELGQTEVQFKATSYWVEKYFVAGIAQNPCSEEQKAYMKKVFDRFEELARCNKRAFDNDGLRKKAVLSPIEFIAVAYLIGQYGATKSNAELEEAIRNMRRKVRAVHADEVRRKPKVWNTLMESIHGSLSPIEPGERPLTPESDRPLDQSPDNSGEATHSITPSQTENQGTKRPFAEDAEDKETLREQLLRSFSAHNQGTKRRRPGNDGVSEKSDIRRRFISQLHEAAIEEEKYRV